MLLATTLNNPNALRSVSCHKKRKDTKPTVFIIVFVYSTRGSISIVSSNVSGNTASSGSGTTVTTCCCRWFRCTLQMYRSKAARSGRSGGARLVGATLGV